MQETSYTKQNIKETRYNLRLPSTIYERLGSIANEEGTTRLELIRKFIKLGLLAIQLNEDSDSGLYIKRNGEYERVMIL